MTSVSISKSPHVKEDGLSELYQSMGLKLALLKGSGDQFVRITPFVQCRDFLVDVYTFSKVGRKFEIYGMEFDPTKEKPATTYIAMALIFPNKEAKTNFDFNLNKLHVIEAMNEYTLTAVFDVDGGKTTVTVGDGWWLNSCLSFSLYTSILRLLCYKKDVEDWSKLTGTDGDLYKSVHQTVWDKVLPELKTLALPDFCGFDAKKQDVSTIHHNSGFYSIFGSHREINLNSVRQNSHWKHFKELGWPLSTQ
jgi:hypothetical protein